MSDWTDRDVDRVLDQLDHPEKMFAKPKELDALDKCSKEYTRAKQKADALFYALWAKARAAERALQREWLAVAKCMWDNPSYFTMEVTKVM